MSDPDEPSDGWLQARKDADETLRFKDGVEMFFRRIRSGTFRMGSRGYSEDEEPIHTVEITRDFYLASFPVTQAQYRVIAQGCREELEKIEGNLGPDPSYFKGEIRPVEQVNWLEAETVAQWLSDRLPELVPRLAGWKARLPTEAEWEYACRAGTETEYWNGDGEAALAEIGWFRKNSEGETHRVGERDPNPWRLHDMHGNVLEWCLDVYDGEAYRLRECGVKNPVVLGSGETDETARVLRGGSWCDNAWHCRSASRYWYRPGDRYWVIGFRLAVVPGPAEPGEAGGREKGAERAGTAKPRRDDESTAESHAQRRGGLLKWFRKR